MYWKWGSIILMMLVLCGCRLPRWVPWVGSETEAAYAVVEQEVSAPEVEPKGLETKTEVEVIGTEAKEEKVPEEKGGFTVVSKPIPAPRRVKMPVPVLPAVDTFDAFAGGWVEVLVRVDEEGRVLEVEALDASDTELVEATLAALAQARYAIEVEEGATPEALPELVYVDRVEY